MKRIMLFMLSAFLSHPLFAQQGPGGDPLEKYTFPPELVMKHQNEIGLSAEQKKAIKNEVQTAQARFTDLQWDLESEMEKFVTLLKQEQIDEERALAVLQKVLELENQIKQTHLMLAIRIKNTLTPEQQAQLQKLKPRMPRAPVPPAPPRMPRKEE